MFSYKFCRISKNTFFYRTPSNNCFSTAIVCRFNFPRKLASFIKQISTQQYKKSWQVRTQKWPVITSHRPLFTALSTWRLMWNNGRTELKNVDETRIIYFSKKLRNENKDVDSSTLPQCKSVLHTGNQHSQQGNFVGGLWKQKIISTPDFPTFCIHGWRTYYKLWKSWVKSIFSQDIEDFIIWKWYLSEAKCYWWERRSWFLRLMLIKNIKCSFSQFKSDIIAVC